MEYLYICKHFDTWLFFKIVKNFAPGQFFGPTKGSKFHADLYSMYFYKLECLMCE